MKHKKFIPIDFIAVIIIGLFPFTSFAKEMKPILDVQPCLIMMDQLQTFLKKDPMKGISGQRFTDLFGTAKTPAQKNEYLLQRAFAPGIGKAFLYQPMVGAEKLDQYLKKHKFRFAPAFAQDQFFPYINAEDFFSGDIPRFFDLSKSSNYFVMVVKVRSAWVIRSYIFKIVPQKGYRELQESGPDFGEGDLWDPSDFSIIHIDGQDYTIINETSAPESLGEEDAKGDVFKFDVQLFPMGFVKNEPLGSLESERSLCQFRITFDIIGKYKGIFKKMGHLE